MDVLRVRIYYGPGSREPGDAVLAALRRQGAGLVVILEATDGMLRGAPDTSAPPHDPGRPIRIVEWVDTSARHAEVWPHIEPLVGGAIVTRERVTALNWVASLHAGHLAGTVDDVMNPNVVAVDVSDPLAAVVELMLGRGLRFVPVLDHGVLTGVITNSDLVERGGLAARLQLHAAGAPLDESAWTGETAGDVMTTEPIVVLSGTPLDAAARLMLRRRVKRLPVLRGGHLVGVVSRFALLAYATHAAPEEEAQPDRTSPAHQIGDLAAGPVPAVDADARLEAVVEAVMHTRLHEAVVIDAERRVLGLIDDRDLLRQVGVHTEGLLDRLMHRHGTLAPAGVTARDLMSGPPLVAPASMPILEAVRMMIDKRVKMLPVVDDEDRLTGIVDRADALRAVFGHTTPRESPS
jgi:CBS domain-containing protein